jgi:hypothetical protein
VLISVITVVTHEVAQLRQLIRGVDAQSRAIDELLVLLDADLVPCRDLVARYEAAAGRCLARSRTPGLLVGPIVEPAADGATAPPMAPDGNAAALRSGREQVRGRPDDPEPQLVEGALAHRRRRRCTGQSAWWEPATTRPVLGAGGTAMRTLPS